MSDQGARLTAGLSFVALVLASGAALRWRQALATARTAAAQVTMIPATPRVPRFAAESLQDAAQVTVATDPFRLANAPARISFASTLVPNTAPVAAASPPPPARPTLIVRAIMGGPPWSAILDGVPGQSPGLVVSPNVTYEQIHILAISRDTVVVQGPDTTWHLTINGGGS